MVAPVGPATSAPSRSAQPQLQRAAEAKPQSTGPAKRATVKGRGGAVTSVDPYASRIGLKVLRQGGNAVDAAVATAAALGVTEPYSAGVGGGGYFVYYDAKTRRVHTIDGRETAPAGVTPTSFVDPATGKPYPFTPELVTSGVAVGVPGTPATWASALDQWGSMSLGETLAPAAALARKGFVVDKTFRKQTRDNAERFRTFTSTSALFLPGGKAPKVGSRLANPDLAATYDLLGQQGTAAFYGGPLAAEIAQTVQAPPKSGATDLPVPVGTMTTADLAGYQVRNQAPAKTRFRGMKVFGMAPSSSGGPTVGEALNILETQRLGRVSPVQAQHRFLDATHLAFADRGEYIGDPAFVDVPLKDLLSQRYADERACRIDPRKALALPTDPGSVSSYDGRCGGGTRAPSREATDTENVSTTNLTVADRRGNVVEYTLTIEQTGGSGIVVPGRGFLLNNELTDFTTVYDADDPNRLAPGKRPRSSMSPTIVLDRRDRPVLALGSPGGSTIITTVLQILLNRFELGMSIERALAAPRAAPNNTNPVLAEPAYVERWRGPLATLGHRIRPIAPVGDSLAEIGAATAIEFGPRGQLTAVAEPDRRGGGAAGVVRR
nr:gamma-glutamyltransferase [Nocardioides flavescens]